jgi:hypothetical protein
VVLDNDTTRARKLGRQRVKPYLGMTNYTSNLRRLGWTDDDLSGDGSDALVDTLAVHGPANEIAAYLGKHLDAGADHVAVQLLTETGADPLPGYQALAAALALPPRATPVVLCRDAFGEAVGTGGHHGLP